MVQLRNFINQIHLWGEKKYDRRVLTTLYTYAPLLVQLDLELYRQMKRQKNKSTIYTKRGKIALKKKNEKSMNLEAVTTTGGWVGCDFP